MKNGSLHSPFLILLALLFAAGVWELSERNSHKSEENATSTGYNNVEAD